MEEQELRKCVMPYNPLSLSLSLSPDRDLKRQNNIFSFDEECSSHARGERNESLHPVVLLL